jgi:hypothetical protein
MTSEDALAAIFVSLDVLILARVPGREFESLP